MHPLALIFLRCTCHDSTTFTLRSHRASSTRATLAARAGDEVDETLRRVARDDEAAAVARRQVRVQNAAVVAHDGDAQRAVAHDELRPQ